jgi:hypothetical protein
MPSSAAITVMVTAFPATPGFGFTSTRRLAAEAEPTMPSESTSRMPTTEINVKLLFIVSSVAEYSADVA